MTTIELKAKLVKQINNLNNNSLLEHISEVIDFETHPDDIHLMSQGETDAVNEGIAQIKNGQWHTNEASDKHVDEWLRKHDGHSDYRQASTPSSFCLSKRTTFTKRRL